MRLRTIALSMIMLASAHVQAAGAKPTYMIEWSENGRALPPTTAQLITQAKNGAAVEFLALESPVGVEKAAYRNEDDGSSQPLSVKVASSKTYILSPSSSGTLDLSAGGAVRALKFRLRPGAPQLVIASSCEKFQPKFKLTNARPSADPAYLSCIFKGDELIDVNLSITANAQWYGSNIFEAKGKGERQKSFEAKELTTSAGWTFAWGDDASKNSVKLIFTRPAREKKKTEAPFSFWAGAALISGSVKNLTTSGSMMGLQIPIGARYHPLTSKFSGTAEYSFFAIGSQSSEKANSASTFYGHIDYEFRFKAFSLYAGAGYVDQSLSLKGIGTTANLDAPAADVMAEFDRPRHRYGFIGNYVLPLGSGQYKETHFGLFWNQKTWLKRGLEISLEDRSLSAALPTAKVDANWLTLAVKAVF